MVVLCLIRQSYEQAWHGLKASHPRVWRDIKISYDIWIIRKPLNHSLLSLNNCREGEGPTIVKETTVGPGLFGVHVAMLRSQSRLYIHWEYSNILISGGLFTNLRNVVRLPSTERLSRFKDVRHSLCSGGMGTLCAKPSIPYHVWCSSVSSRNAYPISFVKSRVRGNQELLVACSDRRIWRPLCLQGSCDHVTFRYLPVRKHQIQYYGQQQCNRHANEIVCKYCQNAYEYSFSSQHLYIHPIPCLNWLSSIYLILSSKVRRILQYHVRGQ